MSHRAPTPVAVATERACAFCLHGRCNGAPCGNGQHNATHCVSPQVTWPGQPVPVPVSLARSNLGACGPEARHLSFAALYQRAA